MNRRRMMLEAKIKEQPINVNLIDSATIRANYYLDTGGSLIYDNTKRTTDYIPVYFGNSYLKSTPTNRDSRLAVYDSNKQFIRIVDYTGSQSIMAFIPLEGDAFIRLGASKTGASSSTTFSFTRTP